MTITSFWFLVFVIAGVLIYYVIPKKLQWLELLLLSVLFYWFAATPYTIVYLIAVTAIAYFVSNAMRHKDQDPKKALTITGWAIAAVVLLWSVVKGRGLWYPILTRLLAATKPSFIAEADGL